MIRVMLMQNDDVFNKTWIILDTCYTDRVKNNLDYVKDAENCDKHE